MTPLYLAGHVLKAQQKNQFQHTNEEAFLVAQQKSHTAARRTLISLAAGFGGLAILGAALQSFG